MNDLISREAVLNILLYHAGGYDYIETETERLLSEIRELPAAEPRRGEWLDACGYMKCSCCGFECGDPYYLDEANYCPDCGARMEESDEGK